MNSDELWRSLENETPGNEGETKLRDASPASLSRVLLAVENPLRSRILFVEIPPDISDPLQAKTRGLTISSVKFGNPQRRWLKFVCNDPGFNQVFSMFSDELIRLAEKADPLSLVKQIEMVVKEIIIFFSEARDPILSLKEQQGLFAELHFLKEYLFPHFENDLCGAIKSWMGPLGAIHDFHIGNGLSVEVKSYSANREKRVIKISRIEQLELLESSCLLLYATEVVTSNSSGKSLNSSVEEIEFILKSKKSDAYHRFKERLGKYGYSRVFREAYDSYLFTITAESLFEVTSSFPRIQKAHLAEAIGNVQYSLDIDQCCSFSMEFETLSRILRRS